jgi:hypothetical protein
MFPPDMYRPEERCSCRDSPSVTSLAIDTAPETVLEEFPSNEGGDVADACLHVSQILRGYVLCCLF